MSLDEAVERADILVLAVWFYVFKQLIARYGERLAGKVIVDPTNPIGPDGSGGFQKVIGEQESSGADSAGLLPTGAWLVKAFGTLWPKRCPRPLGGSPSARCCSTPRTTTLRVTWSRI